MAIHNLGQTIIEMRSADNGEKPNKKLAYLTSYSAYILEIYI